MKRNWAHLKAVTFARADGIIKRPDVYRINNMTPPDDSADRAWLALKSTQAILADDEAAYEAAIEEESAR